METRKRSKKIKKNNKIRILKNFVRLLTLLLVAALLFFSFSCHRKAGEPPSAEQVNGKEENRDNTGDNGVEEATDVPYERTNILLLGIDIHDNNCYGRADTIMLLSIGKDKDDVVLLSIPRDSRVIISERHGLDKLNHAHAYGGPQMIMEAVENFLDLPVHNYARVNLSGFVTLVDVLGGVELYVEPAMVHAEAHGFTRSGLQHLDGKQALEYVSFRKDSKGDIGRVQRQQKLLFTMARETMQLSSIPRIPAILDTVGRNFRTDIPLLQIVSLANRLRHVDLDTIKRAVIPGEGIYINGISYWQVDFKEMEKMLQELGVK